MIKESSRTTITTLVGVAGIVVLVGVLLIVPEYAPQTGSVVPQGKTSGTLLISGYNSVVESYALVVMAGSERGIWNNSGINPDFVTTQGKTNVASDITAHVSRGIKLGINIPSEIILARANGAPVKIVAAFTGEITPNVYTRADSPINTAKDLDGKRIGVFLVPGAGQRQLQFVADTLGFKPVIVTAGDAFNADIRLQRGDIDAYVSSDPSSLQLVESGRRKVVLKLADGIPKPYATFAVWATDDLIEQDPNLVKRFVTATLETVKYLQENPTYTATLYQKLIPDAQPEIARLAVSQIDWRPEGKGSGDDLGLAVANIWTYARAVNILPQSTAVRIEDTINARFLP
jgi:NitT/TauT family transport system substrate-binding protein